MKKYIVFLLMLCLCFGLCACGSSDHVLSSTEESVTTPVIEPELITVDKLLADLDNLARAEQNIGKAIHLFGTIDSIDKDFLTLNHIIFDRTFIVPMETSVLSQLNKGEYIAAYAVVESIDGGDFKFTDCKLLDMKLMDDYIIDIVSSYTPTDFEQPYNDSIITYVMSREDTFKLTDEAEIESYILGEWNWDGRVWEDSWKFYKSYCVTYRSGGQCLSTVWAPEYGMRASWFGSWSIEDGLFDSCSRPITAVYKITQNVMVTSNEILVRVN